MASGIDVTPLISVIIPAYNAMHFVEACLESVLRQTYKHYEILLIDDGSTDETYEVCEIVAKEDNRIFPIRLDEHVGVSQARNIGIGLAEGDYVFFMDSDDLIHPHLLEMLVQKMEETDADLGAVWYRKRNLHEVDEVYREDLKEGGVAGDYASMRERVAASNLGFFEDESVRKATSEAAIASNRATASVPATANPTFTLLRALEPISLFHIERELVLKAIGGKMFRRSSLGGLRFERGHMCGEDTLFLYEFLSSERTVVILEKEWYYYRIYQDSSSNRLEESGNVQRWDLYLKIRDREAEQGHLPEAVIWEKQYLSRLRGQMKDLRVLGQKADMKALKARARAERKEPMFGKISRRSALAFVLCFECYPLYAFGRLLVLAMSEWQQDVLPVRYLAALERKAYLQRKRVKLKNRDFTIISANCNGGTIYQDLDLEYLTPTVGLRFYMDDFVKLIGNLSYYMSLPMVEMREPPESTPEEEKTFPWGQIGDIPVALMHYETFEDAQKKWEKRKRRINWDNLFFMGIDGDRCSEETIRAFDEAQTQAPDSHKVLFAKRPHPGLKSVCYVPGFEDQERVGVLLFFKKGLLRRRYLDDFDYVSWLDQNR